MKREGTKAIGLLTAITKTKPGLTCDHSEERFRAMRREEDLDVHVKFSLLAKVFFLMLSCFPFSLAVVFFLRGEIIPVWASLAWGIVSLAIILNELGAYIKVKDRKVHINKSRSKQTIILDEDDIMEVRRQYVRMFEIHLASGEVIQFPEMKALDDLIDYLEQHTNALILVAK